MQKFTDKEQATFDAKHAKASAEVEAKHAQLSAPEVERLENTIAAAKEKRDGAKRIELQRELADYQKRLSVTR